MTPILWLGVRSFVLALILTPICRDIFRSFGVVDKPDRTRKVHRYPIPRVGGIAIIVSYFGAFFLSRFGPRVFDNTLALVDRLIPAVLVIFAIGLIDDFVGLKPWQKLLGQLGAVALAVYAGVRITFIGHQAIGETLGLVVTVVWLLVCTNAFNLVDGLDGLAAGIGLFATLTIFAGAVIQNNLPLQFATLPLAGCLLAFLCYNFNPATIFLGDSGSLLIGFLLGCYGAAWTQKSVTLLGITAPLIALALPLLDTTLAVVRRLLRRQPIFNADRGHIHHKLLDRGLTPRRVVLMLYGMCGLAAACSLLQSVVSNYYVAALILLLFLGAVWLGIHYLGYAELILVGRIMRGDTLQRAVQARLALSAFESAIASAQSLDDCWQILCSFCSQMGFSAVRLAARGRRREELMRDTGQNETWSLKVPLGGSDHVEFVCDVGTTVPDLPLAEMMEALRAGLAGKLGPAVRSAAAAGNAF